MECGGLGLEKINKGRAQTTQAGKRVTVWGFTATKRTGNRWLPCLKQAKGEKWHVFEIVKGEQKLIV